MFQLIEAGGSLKPSFSIPHPVESTAQVEYLVDVVEQLAESIQDPTSLRNSPRRSNSKLICECGEDFRRVHPEVVGKSRTSNESRARLFPLGKTPLKPTSYRCTI